MQLKMCNPLRGQTLVSTSEHPASNKNLKEQNKGQKRRNNGKVLRRKKMKETGEEGIALSYKAHGRPKISSNSIK